MPRRAVHDLGQRRDVVEVEAQRDPEASVERLREQARTRRRADEREGRQVHLHRARHRALADQDVEAEVLHRRVEDLLDGRRQAVDLVHEEDVVRLQVRQDPGEVARPGDHRARRQPQPGAHLARDDVREGRLAEAGRTRQEHVVERLAAALRRREEDREVLADLRLADVLAEVLGPQLRLDRGVVFEGGAGEDLVLVLGQAATVYRPDGGPPRSGDRAVLRPTSAAAAPLSGTVRTRGCRPPARSRRRRARPRPSGSRG